MTLLIVLFWIALFLVFYTYIGYGILLYVAVRIREALHPQKPLVDPSPWPDITLLIAAYNEEEVVAEKMANCLALDYPADKLHIVWITDGSNDRTNDLLATYPEVTVFFRPERQGKTAALNRAFSLLTTDYVICTDANTMLNRAATREITRLFSDPKVGCVAGEKRVMETTNGNAAATEGLYWRYESKLKAWDDRLYSACGAAGELFAVRRQLYQPVEEDTLLDDFIISMRIAMQGYRIAYCRTAFACETPSANMQEEGKRKRRIAAGGLQAIARLTPLLNPFRYGVFAWQYISHRVLRWSLTPILLVLLLPLNVLLACMAENKLLYLIILLVQGIFYAAAIAGWLLARQGKRNRLLAVPYYFLFMNLNVFRGMSYLASHRGRGVWEKARRA
ncbi:MAG: glycosyltransferase family 2 protein [Alistipes sp.]